MTISTAITTFSPLLAALGIGGVIGQYIATSKDRRGARGSAIEALLVVEQARWVGPPEDDEPPFMVARRKFQSTAIIADLPAEPVRVYLRLAQMAFWHSAEDWEINEGHGEPGMGGTVPVDISKPTQDAARLVAKVIQAGPLRRMWLARKRLGSPSRKFESAAATSVDERWQSRWQNAETMI